MNKRVAGLLAVLVIAIIFYLTFQSPEQTTSLSTGLQRFLETIGIQIGSKPLRHYIHYIIYFILGLVLSLCLKNWKAIPAGCAVALIDELLKIWLPTREFDFGDLLRDFAGVGAAYLLVMIITAIRKK